jgi:hypothetical protein
MNQLSHEAEFAVISFLGELRMKAEIWLSAYILICYLMCSSYITISVDNTILGGEEDPVEASVSQGIGLHLQSTTQSRKVTILDINRQCDLCGI